jgi:hypothetical protein
MDGADGNLGHAELADLAALVDGSLPPSRHTRIDATIERSPPLEMLLDEQLGARAAIRSLDTPAPATLRVRIEALRRARRRRRRRCAFACGFAAALAAATLLAITIPPAGQPRASPTVLDAAALAKRGASARAPTDHRQHPTLLAASVASIHFPDYPERLGWHAAGTRTDKLAGRRTQTVFYDRRGDQVAYTIVSGPALEWPAGARRTVHAGVTLRFIERATPTIVTLLRGGKTCVLSGASVSRQELLRLAAWKGKATGRQ